MIHQDASCQLSHPGTAEATPAATQLAGEELILDRQFAAVGQRFAEIYADPAELGGCVSVFHRGHCVVNIWAGHADVQRTRKWQRGTLVNTMSVTKAMTATCIHQLKSRGIVAYHDLVGRYWPEFEAEGKASIRISDVLDHRAGIPCLPLLAPDALFDRQGMVAAIAAMKPEWAPGVQPGYHVRTQGFVLGEILRRVDGRTLGRYFAEEIARPLGVDFHIGVMPGDLPRCAEFVAVATGTIYSEQAQHNELLRRAAPALPAEIFNTQPWRMSEIPSSNGFGTAYGVARFYAMLANGGELDGVRTLNSDTLREATAIRHFEREAVLGRQYRQALGFLRNSPPVVPLGPLVESFGHHGAGGAVGFADPVNRLGFAFLPSRMHERLDLGPRAGRLIEAVYLSVANLDRSRLE